MNVKEHYDNHLGNFFSWMAGDFSEKQREQKNFFASHNIIPFANKIAFDLGAGHGLQSVSLAQLGFVVKAIDFNSQLVNELRGNKKDLDIEVIGKDFFDYLRTTEEKAELIVCMGDTITHLESLDSLRSLFSEIHRHLIPNGKAVFSFRDLTVELKNEQRFIPVKSDKDRILTCFLEYYAEKVVVYDILHERKDDTWTQKISSYPKLRLSEQIVETILSSIHMQVITTAAVNRMIYMIAQKQ